MEENTINFRKSIESILFFLAITAGLCTVIMWGGKSMQEMDYRKAVAECVESGTPLEAETEFVLVKRKFGYGN